MAREIALTKGRVAIVDDEDFDALSAYRWSAATAKSKNSKHTYASRRGAKSPIYMHREILGAPKGLRVDHINGDGLDNRRCNLRLCTNSQNLANQMAVRNPTGFKGVTPAWAGRWRAQGHNRKALGTFDTVEEAARAYDDYARSAFGAFARLNFPRPGELGCAPEERMESIGEMTWLRANAPGGWIDDLRVALKVIAEMPIPEQDNLIAANMRRVARDALDALCHPLSKAS